MIPDDPEAARWQVATLEGRLEVLLTPPWLGPPGETWRRSLAEGREDPEAIRRRRKARKEARRRARRAMERLAQEHNRKGKP